MYNRAEASQIRQAFWTAFGQYMAPHRSAEGEKLTWINYKTGEKNIRFQLYADTKTAVIGIVLSHPDAGLQQLYFEQFEQYKPMLHACVNESWTWHLHTTDETGRMVSKIFTAQDGVNIMNREDWPALISFFKPRLIALDVFWSNVKYTFEALR